MVSVTSIASSIATFVGQVSDKKKLASKASQAIIDIWKGAASSAFDSTYAEVEIDVNNLYDVYGDINRRLSSLQTSIEREEERRREERRRKIYR